MSNDSADDTSVAASGPQIARAPPLQRRPYTTPTMRRPLPPAPGRAASYCPQTEHRYLITPRTEYGYLFIPSHDPDDETLPGTDGPPQNDPQEATDTNTSEDDTEESDGDVFLSPDGSPRSQDSPDESPGRDDSEQTDPDDRSEQNSANEEQTPTESPSEDPPPVQPTSTGRTQQQARSGA